MNIKKIKLNINYFWISKYNYTNLLFPPQIINLIFNIIIYYKQKYKYFLFINLILLLIFFNPYIKTRFFFKCSPINIIQLNLRGQNTILKFINNYIYTYLPLIDSFNAEFRFFKKKNYIKFFFFKFPLLFELNNLFISLEYLYLFLNAYKFQLEFQLIKKKNNIINYNLLHYLKFPLQIN